MKFWRRIRSWLSAPRQPPPSLPPRPEDASKLDEKFAQLRAGTYRPRRGFTDEQSVNKK